MFEITEQEELALWRKRNKITLKELAEYIDCSLSLISRWECGTANMADEKIGMYRKFVKEYQKK